MPFGFLNVNTTVDTSLDVINPGDRAAEIKLLVFWVASFWVMCMIGFTCALADRWRGPHGKSSIGFAGVVGAFICSAAWPLVAVYLFTST